MAVEKLSEPDGPYEKGAVVTDDPNQDGALVSPGRLQAWRDSGHIAPKKKPNKAKKPRDEA